MSEALDLLASNDQWKLEFSDRVLERGFHYATQDRVNLSQAEGDTIRTTCRGSGGNIYQQTMSVRSRPGGYWLDTVCNCPVGYSCKHCAAAIFHFLGHYRPASPKPGEQLPSELQAWLDDLEKHRPDTAAPKADRQGRGV